MRLYGNFFLLDILLASVVTAGGADAVKKFRRSAVLALDQRGRSGFVMRSSFSSSGF